MSGALVLVGTPIGNLGDLTPRAVEALAGADTIAAEDTRRVRTLLSHAGIPAQGRLYAVHAHNEARAAEEIVGRIGRGERVVVVSDAGMPGVSDPGERLVAAVLAAGLAVEVVPGPSAVLAALVVSGIATGRFVFEGFLPRKGPARTAVLESLAREPRATVLFESPHRVAATLAELADALGPERQVSVSRELTKRFEETWRGTLGEGAAHWAAVEPRGEFVVVLGPATTSRAGDDLVRDAIQEALDAGESTRSAADAVSRGLGVPRREAYALALVLRRGPATDDPAGASPPD